MRPVSIIVFTLLAVLFLPHCADKSGKLTFMFGGEPNEIAYWRTLIGEFEEASGIDVRIIRQPADSGQRRQGLLIPLEAGLSDPDIFLMDIVWIGQFAASGWLQPLDELHSGGFSVDPFFEGIVNSVDITNDTLYALPVYVDGGMLYYRTDLLEKYGFDGPPETWRALIDQAKEIQPGEVTDNPDFRGFVWQGFQYEGLMCTFLEFAASHGGGIAVTDSGIVVDTPENLAGLTLMRNLIHEYGLSPQNTFTEMKEEEARIYFQSGDALFERNWPYAWNLHQSEGSPVQGKVGMALLPKAANGRHVATLGGWHIGVSRSSDRKRDAWEFVRFITSYETQKKLMLNLGWNPGRTDIYTDPEIRERMPQVDRLEEVFRYSVSRPNVPYYNRLSELVQRYVHSCISGELTPGEALRRLEDRLKTPFEDYEIH